MSLETHSQLHELLSKCSMEWLLRDQSLREARLARYAEKLAEADQLLQTRVGADAPRLTLERLAADYDRNPERVEALLQNIGGTSPEMLAMAWRVANGMSVNSMDLDFRDGTSFRLRIELTSPHARSSSPSEVYETENPWDFTILRHFGMTLWNDAPHISGFWPLFIG